MDYITPTFYNKKNEPNLFWEVNHNNFIEKKLKIIPVKSRTYLALGITFVFSNIINISMTLKQELAG